MREDDISYSNRRAREEATRALSLNDPAIAAVHQKLAEVHRNRVAGLVGRQVPLAPASAY